MLCNVLYIGAKCALAPILYRLCSQEGNEPWGHTSPAISPPRQEPSLLRETNLGHPQPFVVLVCQEETMAKWPQPLPWLDVTYELATVHYSTYDPLQPPNNPEAPSLQPHTPQECSLPHT